jgi:hypothetical protein
MAIPFAELEVKERLKGLYTFEAYDFGHCVAGVFGFPAESHYPFIYGFAGRATLNLALKHAATEMLQRLGFLWGEKLSGDLPEFSPTSDYHLEYFLSSEGVGRARDWLDGKNFKRFRLVYPSKRRNEGNQYQYQDITPISLVSKIHVVRAASQSRIPLTFGHGNPFLDLEGRFSHEIGACLIHPIG